MMRALVALAGALTLLLWSSSGIGAQAQPPSSPQPGRVVRLDPALDRIVSVDAAVEKVAGGFRLV